MIIYLDWIERHPGTAGWVQAAGAIIALIIAIAVPAFQWSIARRSARREAAQQFGAIIKILEKGDHLVGDAVRALADADDTKIYFGHEYNRDRFELISGALAKVEIHRLPTAGAVECFIDGVRHYRECCGWIQAAYEEAFQSNSASDHVIEQLGESQDWLRANIKWLDEEREQMRAGKIRRDLRVATIGNRVVGHGRQ